MKILIVLAQFLTEGGIAVVAIVGVGRETSFSPFNTNLSGIDTAIATGKAYEVLRTTPAACKRPVPVLCASPSCLVPEPAGTRHKETRQQGHCRVAWFDRSHMLWRHSNTPQTTEQLPNEAL